jgi:hypothetical protein
MPLPICVHDRLLSTSYGCIKCKNMEESMPNEVRASIMALQMLGVDFDILPALKGGDSHFTEASQCALTCTQDLQLLHGLTPPVRRPKHCGRS